MPVPLLQYLYGPPQWPAVDARRVIPANSVKSLSAQHEAIGRRRGHAGRSAAAAAVVAESVDMRSELRAVLLSHGGCVRWERGGRRWRVLWPAYLSSARQLVRLLEDLLPR